MLKDAGGLLTVDRIRTLIPALRKVVVGRPIELHSHCLTGLAPLVYLEGVKLGCDQLHLSISPLANGAAQPAVQTVVRNLREDGFHVDINDDNIDRISEHFKGIAEREKKPVGVPVEYDAFHYKHQMPGGMLSNFREQLKIAGLSHKFHELLEECARVREELAWPIMITPFSQFVGTQAALNILHGKRYAIVPDEVKKYVLGYFGKLLGPVDPDVMDRIVANGSANIPLHPKPLDPVMPNMRKRYSGASDDELLLRVMFAGNQVDEMKAARGGRPIRRFDLRDVISTIVQHNRPATVFVKNDQFELRVVM
jgi:oxaloacetate decarboxylase alpha subunit